MKIFPVLLLLVGVFLPLANMVVINKAFYLQPLGWFVPVFFVNMALFVFNIIFTIQLLRKKQ